MVTPTKENFHQKDFPMETASLIAKPISTVDHLSMESSMGSGLYWIWDTVLHLLIIAPSIFRRIIGHDLKESSRMEPRQALEQSFSSRDRSFLDV